MTFAADQTFESVDFSARPPEVKEYESCTFAHCNFADCDLSGFRFVECTFTDCNLSNAHIAKTGFQDVSFTNCKLLGMRFDTSHDFGFSIVCSHCQLNHSAFYRVKLNHSSFTHCQLENVDFTEADLTGTTLRDCQLQDATFGQSILIKADLRGSTGYSIDPDQNRLRGARFSLPEVIGLLDKYEILVE